MAPDFLSIHSSLRAEILAFAENLNLVIKEDGCLQRQTGEIYDVISEEGFDRQN
jgi:hypothetical protein